MIFSCLGRCTVGISLRGFVVAVLDYFGCVPRKACQALMHGCHGVILERFVIFSQKQGPVPHGKFNIERDN